MQWHPPVLGTKQHHSRGKHPRTPLNRYTFVAPKDMPASGGALSRKKRRKNRSKKNRKSIRRRSLRKKIKSKNKRK